MRTPLLPNGYSMGPVITLTKSHNELVHELNRCWNQTIKKTQMGPNWVATRLEHRLNGLQ